MKQSSTIRAVLSLCLCLMMALSAAIPVLAEPWPVYSWLNAMHRLYNPNSGEHFYTANAQEAKQLNRIGWNHEGIAWYAPQGGDFPIYRMYNPNAGDHHYTMNSHERDMLKSVGWNYEGIAFYSADSSQIPMYRQYNPNAKAGSHNYTANTNERDFLIKNGWRDEKTAWYAASESANLNAENNMPEWVVFHRKTPAAKANASPAPLQIIDSGYTLSDGYVRYVAVLFNPNTNWQAEFPVIRVTGRRSDGSLLFTDTLTCLVAPAGQTLYYSSQAGNGSIDSSARISFEVSVASSDWKHSNAQASCYKIENLEFHEGSYGNNTITGEITLTRNVSYLGFRDASTPALTVVYNDRNGRIIGGDCTYISPSLSVGVKTPFEISAWNRPDNTFNFEVHASPW